MIKKYIEELIVPHLIIDCSENIFKEYTTGDKKEDFIHVFANIMEGRTIKQKVNLSKTIVKDLSLIFPLVPNIGTNVVEFERASYFNKNMLDPNYKFSMP